MNEKQIIKSIIVGKIKPYDRNVKIHTKEHVERMKKSIEDFGYRQLIGLDKNDEIVFGEGRYLALMEINPNKEILVIDCSDLSDEKIKRLRIVDNQLSNLSKWDEENLQMELKKIFIELDANYERILDEIGLEEELIDQLIRDDESIEDPKPRPKKDPEKQPAQVKHKYICKECGKYLICPDGCQE
jgi:ParB-like chromosome segregation protein Spo0J